MCSEKKRLANQQNAQKSTGPKTDEGKEKSKRNALKHGLTGDGVVLRRTDAKEFARRIDDWRETLAPINPIEETLVARAALASVRLERAIKQESAERRKRIRKALKRLDAKLDSEIQATVATIKCEPARAIRTLKESKRGLGWLITQWQDLADRLAAQGFWMFEEAIFALFLLGKDPTMPYPDDAEVAGLRLAYLGALPEVDPNEAQQLLGLDPTGLDEAAQIEAINARLPEPPTAREALRTIIASHLEQLRAAEAQANALPDLVERKDAVDGANVGTHTYPYRLHRYEMDLEASLHRNLSALVRLRKQEPELATLSRWEKMGKKLGRCWDGYNWVPHGRMATPQPEAQPEPAPAPWTPGREQTPPTAPAAVPPIRQHPSVISHMIPPASEKEPTAEPAMPGAEAGSVNPEPGDTPSHSAGQDQEPNAPKGGEPGAGECS